MTGVQTCALPISDDTNETNYNAALKAQKAANDYIAQLSTDYDKIYKPDLDKYGTELDKLKTTHATLTNDYEALVKSFSDSTQNLTDQLDPLVKTANEKFVKALDPNFDADQYKKINGLGDDVNAYEHYLSTGLADKLVTNDKDKTIADEAAKFKTETGKDRPAYVIDRAKIGRAHV